MKTSLRLAAQRLAVEIVYRHSLEAASVLHDVVLEHPELLDRGAFDTGLRRPVPITAQNATADQAGRQEATTRRRFSVPGRVRMYNLQLDDLSQIWWQTQHAWRDVFGALRRLGMIPKKQGGVPRRMGEILRAVTVEMGSDVFAEDVFVVRERPDRRRRTGVRMERVYLLTYWRTDDDTEGYLFDEDVRDGRANPHQMRLPWR